MRSLAIRPTHLVTEVVISRAGEIVITLGRKGGKTSLIAMLLLASIAGQSLARTRRSSPPPRAETELTSCSGWQPRWPG